MNRDEFIDILKNPNQVSEQTIIQLKEILDEYPFFQAGRMLLLKNMHKLNHIRYNSELKHSAAYIPDRSKLFFLINELGVTDNQVEEAAVEVSVDESEEVENSAVENTSVEENKPEGQSDTQQASEIEEKQEENKTDKPSITATENYLNASDVYSGDDGNVYNFSFSGKDKPKRKKRDEELDDIVFPSADLLDYETTTSAGYKLPKLEEVENVDPNENKTFSDWLHVMRYTAAEEKQEKPEGNKKGMDLINNFLNAQPRIIPSTSNPTKSVDLSEDKSESQEDILSETLAEIYIKQGHKSKAISIFKKLRLKYPEKNVYFAQRISDLKEN